MASITLALTDEMKNEIKEFSWVNWSNIAKEEVKKKEIFQRYLQTRKVTDEDWKFCDSIDWHPVDELPLKKSYIKQLEKARKEKPIKVKKISDIFE